MNCQATKHACSVVDPQRAIQISHCPVIEYGITFFFPLQNPLPGLRSLPSPSNILEWHYVLEGDVDSPYAGGFYHGKIIFSPSYPFKPPAIVMLTPSGRFQPGAKICLSMSDFHPESWNPSWGVRLILLGIQSFFYEESSTTGALQGVSMAERKKHAKESLGYNVNNPTYRKLFPELVQLYEEKKQRESAAAEGGQLNGGCGNGNGPLNRGGPQGQRDTMWTHTIVSLLIIIAAGVIAVAFATREGGLES
jgi:ubiquitin-conjugating enzyme E2 J2